MHHAPRPSPRLIVALAALLGPAGAVAACGSGANGSVFDRGSGGPGDAATDGAGAGGDGADTGTGTASDGSLIGAFDGASSDAGTGGDCSANLTGRLRDFVNKPGFTPASALDDDFENATGDDRGIVATDLGPTGKPVYANPNGTTPTTHGQTQFDWWYRDTPGKNQPFDYTIVLSPVGDGGISSFDDQEFFPLDGRGWDDEYVADDGMMHRGRRRVRVHRQQAGGRPGRRARGRDQGHHPRRAGDRRRGRHARAPDEGDHVPPRHLLQRAAHGRVALPDGHVDHVQQLQPHHHPAVVRPTRC
jgi:hypothetical protein